MMDSIGTGRLFNKTVTVAEAIRQQSISEELFSLGKAFSFDDYFVMIADQVFTFIIDTSLFNLQRIVFEPLVACATSGPLLIDFYAGTTAIVGGTELGVSNRDATSLNTPLTKVILDPTTVTLGTRFSGDMINATGQGAGNVSGGTNARGLPFAINPGTNYAFTVTNEGAAGWWCIKLNFFEF